MLVDDDPAVLAALGAALETEGSPVARAGSVELALPMLMREQVDLIIANSLAHVWEPSLPVVHRLKLAAPTTPLVLHTGFAEAAALDLLTHDLAGGWIKPIGLPVLLAALREVLAGTRGAVVQLPRA